MHRISEEGKQLQDDSINSRLIRLAEAVEHEGADGAYIRDVANIEWLTGFEEVFDEEQAHAVLMRNDVDGIEGNCNGGNDKSHPAAEQPRSCNSIIHTDSRYSTAMEREAQGSPFLVDASAQSMPKWAAQQWNEWVQTDYQGGLKSGSEFCRHCLIDNGKRSDGGIHDDRKHGRKSKLAIEDSISLAEYRDLQKAFGLSNEGLKDACLDDAYLDDESAESSGSEPSGLQSSNFESSGSRSCAPETSTLFVETHDLILKLRAVKDARELELMREAQAVTDAAFDHILGFIKPGMTERQIQLELDDFMMRNGADSLAFPSIVASGANGASPHAIVSDKPIEPGECIVMDFGARRRGYCSDMTRTVFIGNPDGEMIRAWETLRHANETVEEQLRPGMTGREAHELALSILEEGGFEGRMGHGLGHGVGIQIHELPVLSTRNEHPLVEGNVVTVEPGIYIPGAFGMRLEDCGVITASGYDRFTRSTHELIIL